MLVGGGCLLDWARVCVRVRPHLLCRAELAGLNVLPMHWKTVRISGCGLITRGARKFGNPAALTTPALLLVSFCPNLCRCVFPVFQATCQICGSNPLKGHVSGRSSWTGLAANVWAALHELWCASMGGITVMACGVLS